MMQKSILFGGLIGAGLGAVIGAGLGALLIAAACGSPAPAATRRG